MNLCDNNHLEIAYDTHHCPVCLIIEKKDNIIEDLKKRIDDYKDEVKDLEANIRRLKIGG